MITAAGSGYGELSHSRAHASARVGPLARVRRDNETITRRDEHCMQRPPDGRPSGGLVLRLLALEGLHEPRPVGRADPQYRPAAVVLGVPYGDVSGRVADFYAVARVGRTAVAGLTPCGVHLLHLSVVSLMTRRDAARGRASALTRSKVADTR